MNPPIIKENWEVEFAALSQQVAGLDSDYRDIKIAVVNLDKKIDTSFTALSAKIDSTNAIPWTAIWAALGFVLTGMTTVGYLALQPLQTSILQLRQEQSTEASHRTIEDSHLRDRVDRARGDLDQLIGSLRQSQRP